MIVLNGKEGLECEVYIDGIRLEHVRNSNIWDAFWTNQVQEKRKTWKSRSEEKVVDFSSANLFPTRKREVVTQGGTMEPGT